MRLFNLSGFVSQAAGFSRGHRPRLMTAKSALPQSTPAPTTLRLLIAI